MCARYSASGKIGFQLIALIYFGPRKAVEQAAKPRDRVSIITRGARSASGVKKPGEHGQIANALLGPDQQAPSRSTSPCQAGGFNSATIVHADRHPISPAPTIEFEATLKVTEFEELQAQRRFALHPPACRAAWQRLFPTRSSPETMRSLARRFQRRRGWGAATRTHQEAGRPSRIASHTSTSLNWLR